MKMPKMYIRNFLLTFCKANHHLPMKSLVAKNMFTESQIVNEFPYTLKCTALSVRKRVLDSRCCNRQNVVKFCEVMTINFKCLFDINIYVYVCLYRIYMTQSVLISVHPNQYVNIQVMFFLIVYIHVPLTYFSVECAFLLLSVA